MTSNLKNLLNFQEVASELGCDPGGVRTLVVEERRLPALYVTFMGHVEPYDRQVVKVDDSGMVFDLCKGFENPPHIGYLRVAREEFERFCEQNALVAGTRQREERPLGTIERNTLLTIIAALAKEARVNISQPGKAALAIESLTDQLGTHVSKRAIEDHLKRIPDALETRMK